MAEDESATTEDGDTGRDLNAPASKGPASDGPESEDGQNRASGPMPSDAVPSGGTSTLRRLPWILAAVGIAAVALLGGMIGVFGYRILYDWVTDKQRETFVLAARQTAEHLTTIDHTRVEADIQRILDGATGAFREDFESRSEPFAEVVRQAKSTTKGTVTEAGVEQMIDGQGLVLVAVTVESSVPDSPEQEPRAWRMRMTVEQDGDEAKVSLVEFVP